MLVAGVDDAGRGPVIGPLLIAGVLMDEKDLPELKTLGVKDSKMLSPRRREELSVEIRRHALRYHAVSISPAEIDNVVETGRRLHRLNRLEAHTMARVIDALRPQIAYVDASDVDAERFGQHIEEKLDFKVTIVSEHKADVKYPIVSAASIIAKVERDSAIQRLQDRYAEVGDLGSGYASDPTTIQFLEKWIARFGEYPGFVRKSWKPAKDIKNRTHAAQTKLK